jgi:hypothetical protein
MDDNTIILTRKIQLIIDSDDKEFIGQTYETLYRWRNICFKAANTIFTHRFVQEQVKELIYLTEETKVKLADKNKDEEGILTTSGLNSTLQLLSKRFKGQIPIHILSSLNMTLARHFNNEKRSYMEGERSIRNYRRDIPIPFRGSDITHLRLSDDGKYYRLTLFKILFRTYLGKDFYDKRQLLGKVLTGEVKLCTSSLKLEGGKIFLLAAFKVDRDVHSLDSNIIAEASLSLDHPIIVKIGKTRHTIGSKEEFLHRRLAIQSARHRVQHGATHNRSQHGRKRKLKALDRFKRVEYNYVAQKLHLYSRRLIDLCIKHKAATLLLVNQKDKEETAKADEFLFRNWSYYSLKEKIVYKAAKAGIEVIIE